MALPPPAPPPLPPPPPVREPASPSRSGRWRTAVLVAMVPLHLVGIAWVWFGRAFFGVAGWMLLLLALTVVPVLVVALIVTSILAFTQDDRPDGPRLSIARPWPISPCG